MKTSSLVLSLLVLSFIFLKANPDMEHNMELAVPELSAYHNVIATVWHKAIPNNDFKLLKELSPEIVDGALNIKNAKLPRKLADKQEIWKKNADLLYEIASQYNKAAKDDDDKLLLVKAKELHNQFAKLVAIVNPPKIPGFEQVKAITLDIKNNLVPSGDFEAITKAVTKLQKEAEVMMKAEIPCPNADKKKQIIKLRKEIYADVQTLVKIVEKGHDLKAVSDATGGLYSKIDTLENIVEIGEGSWHGEQPEE